MAEQPLGPAGEQLTIDWKPIPRHVLTPVGHLSFGTKPADGSDVVSIVVKGRNEWDPVQPDYDVWFKVRRAGLLARLFEVFETRQTRRVQRGLPRAYRFETACGRHSECTQRSAWAVACRRL